jgi:hypothetical protein
MALVVPTGPDATSGNPQPDLRRHRSRLWRADRRHPRLLGANIEGETTPPTDRFRQVEAGDIFGCGVKTDGTPACWGFDAFGQATPPDIAWQPRLDARGHPNRGVR